MTVQEVVARGKALAHREVPAKDLEVMRKAFDEYGGVALVEMPEADKIIRIAEAVNALEDAFTPAIMEQIMRLMGRQVGFRTDQDRNGGYPVGVVKEVMIEGVMYGARPTGNEINIIADRCYLTKEHFTRKVKELPGLTDLEVTIGVPKIEIRDQKGNGIATVNCRARWKMHGKEMAIGWDDKDPCNIAVKVFDGKGGGADQAIGKCERKLKARIWQRATGSTISLPEGDIDAHEVAASVVASEPAQKAEVVAQRLAERKGGNGKQAVQETPAAPQEREPGSDDDAQQTELPLASEVKRAGDDLVAPPPAPTEPPPSYQRLARAYDSHAALVDATLKEFGFGSLPEIGDPENLAALVKLPEQMQKLARVAAKVASKLSK